MHGADSIKLQPWLNDLAAVYKQQDRYPDAEALYQRALAIVEKTKGPDDPEILDALEKLAAIYTGIGRQEDAKAEPLYQRAIAILEKAEGADSPALVKWLNSLGLIYQVLHRNDDAEAVYRRTLEILENANGPDAPEIVPALDKLASLYSEFGHQEYAKADPLYQRSLSILEKARGADHPDVVRAINNLASSYVLQRRYDDAAVLYVRALAIRDKEADTDGWFLRNAVENLASTYEKLRRYPEAEQLYKRLLTLTEKQPDADKARVRGAVENLARLYSEAARYADAEPFMRRELAMSEEAYNADRTLGIEFYTLQTAQANLARLLKNMNRLPDAEAIYRRILSMAEEREGPDSPSLSSALAGLGGILADTNRLDEAETMLRRAVTLVEEHGGNADQAEAFNNLALLLIATNRLAEAESLYRRALPLAEHWRYPPQLASVLSNFAVLLQNTGRPDEAEPLLRRALAIDEEHFGTDHPDAISPLNNLAALLEETGRYPEAEQLLRRSLAIAEKAFGPDHPKISVRLNNLAALLVDTDRFAEAEPLLRRALAVDEKNLGLDHPGVTSPLTNLAELLLKTGRLPEAERVVRRALSIDEKSYGPAHPNTSRDLHNLAVLRSAAGDWTEAAHLFGRMTAARTSRVTDAPPGDRQGLTKALLKRSARSYRQQARGFYRVASEDKSAAEDSFAAAQWALQSDAGDALAQMSARFAKGEGPLIDLVRQRQNLMVKRSGDDKNLLAAAGRDDLPAAEVLRKSISETDNQLDIIDGQLAGQFPDYADLTNPKPLTIADVQALLAPEEALLLFLDVSRIGPLPGETLIWVITRETAIQRSASLDTEALSETIETLRCGLDQTLWQSETTAGKCRTALTSWAGGVAPEGRPPQLLPFDLARAYQLYQALLGPDDDLIRDKHLLIVPSGPLTSLPFSVLVTAAPEAAFPATVAGYGGAAWLGTRQPISILPSVASLKALRRLANTSKATKPYLGIGNPLLDGDQDDRQFGAFYAKRAQTARDKQHCQQLPETRVVLATSQPVMSFDRLFRGTHADIEQIRQADPLPETADEICDVGRRLGASDDDILLGSRASETTLKKLSDSGRLADYRFLHFATHGALAGEVENAAEPGLLLTPPAKGTHDSQALERDDGFLTASEIASLKLNTDWVILSACNTASGASEKAEALSGLARAFFYAGARSLLVSHWAVNSDATVKLVTGAFEVLTENPKLTHAEVLQQSILALVSSGGNEAHPSRWAPFVVVGADTPAQTVADASITPPLPSRPSFLLAAQVEAEEQPAVDEAPTPPIPVRSPFVAALAPEPTPQSQGAMLIPPLPSHSPVVRVTAGIGPPAAKNALKGRRKGRLALPGRPETDGGLEVFNR